MSSQGSESVPSVQKPPTLLLFAYFEEKGHDGLCLAWSEDGLKWQALNEGRPVLAPQVGEAKLMRDPYLLRGPDGTFHLLWTTGWMGRAIGYASSRDLKSWSQQRLLGVMEHEPNAQNCWAPEAVWDEEREEFLIFWSSTVVGRFLETEDSNLRPDPDLKWKRNHRIYAASTRDFQTLSPTRLFYDGGFNVIDAHLLREGDGWLLFVKDETLAPQRQKNIRLVHAQSLDGPFSRPSPPLTGDYWAEGPTAIKRGGEWWVYFDKHDEEKYGLVCSRDLERWDDRSDELSMPSEARHGNVLEVPREIIETLSEVTQ